MRSRALLMLGGISAAIVGLVVLALWQLGSTVGAREPFSTIELVPEEVDMYVALNTAPSSSQWIAFSNLLDTVNVEDSLRDAWNDVLSEADLRWDEDIVSLLGDEAYVAVTDFSALDEWHGVVGVFQLRDSAKAEDLFLRLAGEAAAEEGTDILESQYEGATIYYMEEESYWGDSFGLETDELFEGEPEVHDTGAIAFVDDLAVFGLSRDDVTGVIDVIQGRVPSAGDPRLEELRARQTEDFLVWGYVDLASGWEAVEELMADAEDEIFDDSFLEEARANADRITFTVSARSDGFVVDVTMLRSPDAAADGSWALDIPFESHYAQRLPEDTLAFVAGYDLYNKVYVPIYDAVSQIDMNLADPYCSDFGGLVPISTPGFGESDDPVLGQFEDDEGNVDWDAYWAWEMELEEQFTDEDGFVDYDAYWEYLDGLYAEACEESSQTLEEAIAELEGDLGFDIEDDLLGLMTGEFALALNASNFSADEPDFDILGLIDVTDAARAVESMELLGRYLEREADVTAGEADALGVHRLSADDDTDTTFAWAVTGDSLAVGYPDTPVEEFAQGGDAGSLAESADWTRTMALLPEEKTFVAYVNLARILEEIQDIEDVSDEFADVMDGDVTLDDLRPIRSLALATSPVEGGWLMRAVVFVKD